ncbi:MAG: lysoplasmalogenase [Caldilineales bacterium]|nr:lysoplasmalogenase [Caldilineales bacterium]MDW8318706.1 lysoplasmalogenase family protein [Anaerolineae bacterium]
MSDFFQPASLLAVLLWVVWAALLTLGLVLGQPDAERRTRLPLGVRMGLSVTLVAAAAVAWLRGAAGSSLEPYAFFLLLGMAFGLLGDLFMARLIVPAPNHVIFGILAFGVGHLWYIAAFGQARQVLAPEAGVAWPVVGLYLAAAVGLWWAFVREPAQGAVLNVGTLGYSLLLSGMAAAAASLALAVPVLWPAALGGVFFMASDLILGAEIMRGRYFPGIGDAVWITYTVAQMLIVYSAWAALAAL